MLREPVTGPSAWSVHTVGDGADWITQLSPADVGLLEEAASDARTGEASRRREVWRARLAGTSLGDRLEEVVREVESGRGFALLRGLPVDRYAPTELEAMYLGIGSYIGTVIPQNAERELVARVTARAAGGDARGYASNGALAAHTDAADMVGLLCVRKARRGGVSAIASAMTIYNLLLRDRPDLLDDLYRGYLEHWPERVAGGEVESERQPVYSYHQGLLSCSFHPGAIEKAMRLAGKALSDGEGEALRWVQALAAGPELQLQMDLSPGDLQLLNNFTILHARTAFEDDPDPTRRRLLLRMWINRTPGRPLDPTFARLCRRGFARTTPSSAPTPLVER